MSDPLVAAAEASIAAGSRSFAMAARLFDRPTRERAMLLYAWCRHCDDVIDGQAGGQGRVEHDTPPAERLAAIERLTRTALRGEATGEPPFDALARVAAETAMPHRYPLDLIEGFRLDVEEFEVATEAELLTYCYHVAGVVGVMMAIAMGVPADDEATLDRACDLGLAFQLNNIARDVLEDAAIGRRYLPASWLEAEGVPVTTFAAPEHRAGTTRATRRLVELAERYEASARHGVGRLPWRAAWAVLAAARIYGGIGRRVRRLGEAADGRRVHTSAAEKLAAVALELPRALLLDRFPGDGRRDGLWTMRR